MKIGQKQNLKQPVHIFVTLAIVIAVSLLIPCAAADAAQTKNERTPATRLDIALVSPVALKTGDNPIEVMVKQADGQPLVEAEVSVAVMLPGAPDINRPELRNTAKLKPMGAGKYTGSVIILVAGDWTVTVTVKKEGKELGQKKTTLSAK